MKVITYQAPNGATINVTEGQIKMARQVGAWPRSGGQEYCTVSHGLHTGEPTYTSDEWIGLLSL